MNARHEEKRGGTVLHEVKPTRTTRNQCYGKMRSRAPSKPCLRATFLLRFLTRTLVGHGQTVADRLIEVLFDIDSYGGTGRIFLP
jgi:hypothetical protein